jgi:hypothetical protein
MKSIFLWLTFVLFVTNNGSAQKKEMQKKATDTTLDFLNPNSAQKISWQGFRLSQDKRDIDLYFMYDGKNLVVRQ